MAKKLSNKARIQQMAEEAAAGEEEKKTKKKTKKVTKVTKKKTTKKKASTKKATAAPKQLKVVWKVFDAGYKEVACFPYPEKDKAYTKAEDLAKKNKKSHFVNAVKVPME